MSENSSTAAVMRTLLGRNEWCWENTEASDGLVQNGRKENDASSTSTFQSRLIIKTGTIDTFSKEFKMGVHYLRRLLSAKLLFKFAESDCF